MIRSRMLLALVVAGLASPALGQDRRAEANAAAARAEEAAADALRAAEASGVEPEDDVTESALPAGAPPAAVEWIAEPVVQPVHPPAPPLTQEIVQPAVEPAAPTAEVLAQTVPDAVEDAGPAPAIVRAPEPTLPPVPGEPAPDRVVEVPLGDAAQAAPRPMRRTARPVRVQLAYSPEQRLAWLAQCRTVYRGSYDCDGYLAQYEQAFATALGEDPRAMPMQTRPAGTCQEEPRVD